MTSWLAARAAILAAAVALVALVALLALHILKPDLHPSRTMISRYALGPFGWVMTPCFAGLGVANGSPVSTPREQRRGIALAGLP